MNPYRFHLIPSFILLFGLFFASCKSAEVTTTEAVDMKTAAIIQKAFAQKPTFTHLNIQSKINTDIDDISTSLNGRIYIFNGKKIWVNVSKFGINGARAEITPKGFKAYEKIERTYIDGDFTYFNRLLKVDFIDYDKLQNLLLGRVFVEMKPADFQTEIIQNQYVLNYKENAVLKNNPKPGKYIQTYTFGADFYLREALLIDPHSGMELSVSYSNWIKVGKEVFPKNVKIIVKDKKTQKVELEYNNFTFEQINTPFEIPSGYKPNAILK